MKVEEKRVEDTKVAYVPYKGSYDKIPELMLKVGQWVADHGLEMTGLVYGTYYNTPEEVAEADLQYEIGFSFSGEAYQDANVGVKEIPAHTVLAALHQGPYTEIGPVIHAVVEYAVEQGYDIVGPITEVYLNDPNTTPEDELRTEVHLPVIKK